MPSEASTTRPWCSACACDATRTRKSGSRTRNSPARAALPICAEQLVAGGVLAFDHYYSDAAFQQALDIVLSSEVRRLLDVGGNTGRFAQLCLKSNPDVLVTIADHPVQVESAKARLGEGSASSRVAYLPRNLLSEERYPGGYCAIWLSQLLDCLGEDEVTALLRSLRYSLRPGGRLFVLEPCWDLQRQRAGMEALTLLSLYFTSVANGNSRMYDSPTLTRLISAGGFSVLERRDNLGVGHSLFVCEPVETG